MNYAKNLYVKRVYFINSLKKFLQIIRKYSAGFINITEFEHKH